MNTTQKIIIGCAVVVALASTAVASSYITRGEALPEQKQVVHRTQAQRQRVAATQPAPLPPCNDHNIVGTLGGGLAGGLVGNQFGKGNGKTVATVAGAAGGAYLGNEYIPTRGATCQ